MKKSRRFNILLYSIFTIFAILILYARSFEDIEPVCKKTETREIFLLNYVSKENLKTIIYNHNKNFNLENIEFTRIYLKRPIFKIEDPILGDEYDYKPRGCDNIDNMDIYCEVRYRKLESGKTDVWYNFME